MILMATWETGLTSAFPLCSISIKKPITNWIQNQHSGLTITQRRNRWRNFRLYCNRTWNVLCHYFHGRDGLHVSRNLFLILLMLDINE